MSPRAQYACSLQGCTKRFPTIETLREHKQMESDHPYCAICDVDFRTKGSLLKHMESQHPQDQDLSCKGCRKHFTRYTHVISHYENNECPNPAFSTKKNLVENSPASPVVAEAETNSSEWEWSSPSDASKELRWEFPQPEDSIGNEGTNTPTWGEWTAGGELEIGSSHSGSSNNRPTPDEDSVAKYAVDESFKKNDPNLSDNQSEERSPYDPDHPDFNVEDYWVEILGRFKCPRGCTGKHAKHNTGALLIKHLKSPVHRRVAVLPRCPTCQKAFHTLTALAQHAESPSVKCGIRNTDGYDFFVEQLSSGLVTAEGYHLDGTTRYVVDEDAAKKVKKGKSVSLPREINDIVRNEQQRQRNATCVTYMGTYGKW